jgi:hypothetical protein
MMIRFSFDYPLHRPRSGVNNIPFSVFQKKKTNKETKKQRERPVP